MKNEVPDANMDDPEYLTLNFPPCMTKKSLAKTIREYDGVVGKKSRPFLVNELEMIILFHIRGNRTNGYTKLFYSPEEIVEDNYGYDSDQLKEALKERGVICPKKVIKQKKLLIDLLRKEMGETIHQTFCTVVKLELDFFRCKVSSTQLTDQFIALYHASMN